MTSRLRGLRLPEAVSAPAICLPVLPDSAASLVATSAAPSAGSAAPPLGGGAVDDLGASAQTAKAGEAVPLPAPPPKAGARAAAAPRPKMRPVRPDRPPRVEEPVPRILIGRATAAGRTLSEVLADLEKEGRLSASQAERALSVFDDAVSAELAALPKLWHFVFSGKLKSFRIADGKAQIDAGDCDVHTVTGKLRRIPRLSIVARYLRKRRRQSADV
eukprot:NODE_15320_length_1056_cov_4.221744.p1 GENE.NODE_15320_length_1056_cov_4.221744~~NODE_15320_length_1056_cov_4.221744.p1  ORF type:complete len:242 (-),score=70.25 NODE_15320_length_1056_cov_4.221744:331-981(-)